MRFEDLVHFLEHEMRMSHVYQPVVIRTLLDGGGRASAAQIAQALVAEDRSQLEYYEEIAKNMVGRVLANRGVIERDKDEFRLVGFGGLSPGEVSELRAVCGRKLAEYVEKRGRAIWEHRRRSAKYISGSLRYEVLKGAKFRCELCGVSADERALEVDHIVPRSKGGMDEAANLQAFCYRCNAMKRDRDDTDFRGVRKSYEHVEEGCPFCVRERLLIVLDGSLAFATRDRFPVTTGHMLIIPKRHAADYFDLGSAEIKACQQLLAECRSLLLREDGTIAGFNVGINSGEAAGQTVMHCHLHLIARRIGDHPNPRGGVRAVLPGKADYSDAS